MNNLLPTFPEISIDLANLHIRTDLINRSVSIYFNDVNFWDVDTSQVQISESLIHFIEPESAIFGIKCFSVKGDQQ